MKLVAHNGSDNVNTQLGVGRAPEDEEPQVAAER